MCDLDAEWNDVSTYQFFIWCWFQVNLHANICKQNIAKSQQMRCLSGLKFNKTDKIGSDFTEF